MIEKNNIINYYYNRGLKYIEIGTVVNKKINNTTIQNLNNNEILDNLEKELDDCKLCPLCEYRNKLVFGKGCSEASLMLVGEAPGGEEDKTGLPFVGKAGLLLNKIILAMGLSREEIYIANLVKCRPLANRNPNDEEIDKCSKYLNKQIDIIKPKVIIALGAIATNYFYQKKVRISYVRGQFFEYNDIKVMPTYHPAYLLRNPADKRLVWNDVQKVMEYLDLNKKN